jgi:chaperonin GroEL (HSP60 family)
MAAKQLVFSEEARRRLQRGMDLLATAVVTTLGPKGRNVAVDRKYGSPTITHDGVTVAKEIELEESFENMGAQLLKEAATKTNDTAGDGTTTSTLLAHSIVTEGMKNLAAGFNPMLLKRGIEAATKAVADTIKEQAIEITTKDEIANVASISAQDRTIGELIAEVMDKVGKDGVITVEESKGLEFGTEYVEGMQFDRGFVSAYFITDPEHMESSIEDAYTLVYDKKISLAQDIVPGGGVALINAMSALDKVEVESDDAKIGVNIVRKALEFPMKMIAENAGKDGAVVLDNVRRAQKEKKNKNVGYNVLSEDYVDMVKDGVIDPAKVTRGALENAASIAAMILTTEALITDMPEKERPAPPPMPEY